MEKTGGRKSMEIEVVIFVLGVVMLVGSIVIYMRREDNDFKKFVDVVTDVRSRLDDLEKKVDAFGAGQRTDCEKLTGEIDSLRAATAKLDDTARKPIPVSVTFPHTVPVNLVYTKKETKPLLPKEEPLPMLNRAGIKTKTLKPKDNN